MKTGKLSDDFWVGMATPYLILLWIAPAWLFKTWVATVMWDWYVVPAFHVQPLRIVTAFGIALLLADYRHVSPRTEWPKMPVLVLRSFLWPMITLAFGWFGSFFV